MKTFVDTANVVGRDDTARLGAIRVTMPGLGLPNQASLLAYPVRPPRKHKVPAIGDVVLVEGRMDGNELTLFWLGVVSTEKSPPPGRDVVTDPAIFANNDIEDFGLGRVRWDPETNTFTIALTSAGANSAQIQFNATTNQITVLSGGGDVIFNGSGPRFALQGDTVMGPEGPGTIVSGSAPCQGKFPR